MGKVKITNKAADTNPSINYFPYNAGGYFADSPIFFDPADRIVKSINPTTSNLFGFKVDQTNDICLLGDDNNSIQFNGSTFVITSPSAIATGSFTPYPGHLVLILNGTTYKIQLLQ